MLELANVSPGQPQAELTVSGALMQVPGDFVVGVEAGQEGFESRGLGDGGAQRLKWIQALPDRAGRLPGNLRGGWRSAMAAGSVA